MGISLKEVGYTYERKKKNTVYALKGVSLCVNDQDELIALVGETGSGKSTLATIMNALKVPTEGEAFVYGIKLSERRKRNEHYNRIRKHVGLVFQFPDYQLFEETVLKDTAYGPRNFGRSREEAENDAKKALEMVHFPIDAYNKSPFTLSGGEKKMASIAGILAGNPDILIFDEPTAGLDPEAKSKLLSLIKELNQESHKSIIVITHDMNIVYALMKRVIVMNNGELIYDGSPDQLFNEKKDVIKEAHLDEPDVIRIESLLYDRCHLKIENKPKTLDELVEAIRS